MKCSKCGHKNLYQANFCEKCGSAFDDAYKEKAYSKTIYGIINKIEEIYSWLTLDVILGNKFVKIFLLVSLLFAVGNKVSENGNEFIIKDEKGYYVQYNQTNDEYYIVSKDYEVNLALYIPKKVENLIVNEYNMEHTLINSTTYTVEDAITLLNEQDRYYNIQANYENASDNLTVFVYWGE